MNQSNLGAKYVPPLASQPETPNQSLAKTFAALAPHHPIAQRLRDAGPDSGLPAVASTATCAP